MPRSGKYPALVSWGHVQEGRTKVTGAIPEILGRSVRIREEEHGTENDILFILASDSLTQATGSFAKSMVSDLLDKLDGMEERGFQERAIKECAATVYIGMYVFSSLLYLAG